MENDVPRTPVNWIKASDRLPTKREFGPYPYVLVALACRGNPEWGHKTQPAELRFFGGDPSRHYWVETKNGNPVPIENEAWFVEYWAYPLQQPTSQLEN